ncbi:MAG TPA: DNA polymerase/3'-5' exonuclease PolX [Gammaproteobacteria bacterium]
MPVQNVEIAELFNRLADLLEIEDANPFRVRAYRNAARVVSGSSRSMADLIAEGRDLDELPGIGKDLAAKIATIVNTGRLPQLEQIETRTPRALSQLMQLPGLGPKRVKLLYRELNIRSPEDLTRAVRSGRLATLPGFGPKIVARIAAALEQAPVASQRLRLDAAEQIAKGLVNYLQRISGVKSVEVAGSFRRRRDTVGDLDILVTCRANTPVMQRFVKYDAVAEIISQGTTRSSVRLRSGVQVDLRVVPAVSRGAALYYFTGSKAHNIAVRKIAVQAGLKINEYGVFRGDQRIAGRTEQDVFAAVNLPWIEPELRENRGEIEAAQHGTLPKLITLSDIRGDLHCHTRETDGEDTLQDMARAAQAHDYAYLAITDHSRRVSVAHGMDSKRLMAQIRAIDKLNAGLENFRLLKSVEVDILEDGRLDMPDRILKQLDLVVGAVHYKLDLPRSKQMSRLLRAMDNRYLSILAHPTGRLINSRAPMDLDMEKLLLAAREQECAMEINAQPERLDLDDIHCKLARDTGVKLVISSDAHSSHGLDGIRFGVDQARRGWLNASQVLNTLPVDKLLAALRR